MADEPPISSLEGEAAAERKMNLNPDPLKVVNVQRCRQCKKRAPWCSCGAADYA